MTARQNPEVAAMEKISKAIEDLDRPARDRVLSWARQCYVDRPLLTGVDVGDAEYLTQFMTAFADLARKMQTQPIELIQAVERAWKLAQEEDGEKS